jgi:hypothetical protein
VHAPNGIVLNNTGNAGGLTVTGDGGACTIATPTCTGGTIQNTTGDGISLTGTGPVQLTGMRVRTSGGHGVNATGATALTFNSSYLERNGNGDDENSINLVNAGGSTTLDATQFLGAAENLVRVNNTNANLNLTVRNGSHFEYPNPKNSAFANSAVLVTLQGSSVVNASVVGSTFKNIPNNSVNFGGDLSATGSSTLTFNDNNVSVDSGLNTLCSSNSECRVGNVAVGGSGGTINFVATGNTFNRVNGDGVMIIGANQQSTTRARVQNNSFTDVLDDVFVLGLGQNGRSITQITQNTMTNVGGDALEVASGEENPSFGTGSFSDMDLVFTNNSMNTVGTNAQLAGTGGPGIFRFGDADQELCLAFTGNSMSGPTPVTGLRAYLDGNFGNLGGFIKYEGSGTGSLTDARIQADNPGMGLNSSNTVISAVNLSGGVSCQRPGI